MRDLPAAGDLPTRPPFGNLESGTPRLLTSEQWKGIPGSALLQYLQDIGGIDAAEQDQISKAPFSEVRKILFD